MQNTAIASSVLPLNSDGSVYHLNLHPTDIANTVILVGDPDRVQMVSAFFDRIDIKKQRREFVTHTGYINNQRISVMSTGMGGANIEIALNELDALKNIDLSSRTVKDNFTQLTLLRIGTCGALQANTPAGGIILSQYAIGFDGAMNFYPCATTENENKLKNMTTAFLPDTLKSQCYVSSADNFLQKLSPLGESGITLTCPGFYAAQNRELRIPINNQDLFSCTQNINSPNMKFLNFEMETAMLYGLGRALNHRCGSISLAVYNRQTQQQIAYKQAMPEFIEQCLTRLIT